MEHPMVFAFISTILMSMGMVLFIIGLCMFLSVIGVLHPPLEGL